MSQLKLNYEFNMNSYNVFEISQTGQILSIDLNKMALICAKVPLIANIPEIVRRQQQVNNSQVSSSNDGRSFLVNPV
jgi:hypothetical protein